MTSPTIIITAIISIITIQSPIIALFNYTLCKKEIPEFSGKKTYPLTSLNELKTLDDLNKFGLCSPDDTDHKKGKQLILLALKGDPINSPDWVLSYGLLGTSMLNISPLEKAAYKSFFLALNNFNFYKMTENQSLMFLVNDPIEAFNNTQSIITKRELIILGISRHIHNRFSYSSTGDSKKIYSSEKNRTSHKSLIELFSQGLILHNKIKDKKINDDTLKTVLGMAYAVLTFDSVKLPDNDLQSLENVTICQDSLKITLDSLKDRPTHGYKFLMVLNSKMNRKKLPVTDTFLFSTRQLTKKAIFNLINQDIDKIEIKDLNNEKSTFLPTLNQMDETTIPDPKEDEKDPKNTNKKEKQTSEKKQPKPDNLTSKTSNKATSSSTDQNEPKSSLPKDSSNSLSNDDSTSDETAIPDPKKDEKDPKAANKKEKPTLEKEQAKIDSLTSETSNTPTQEQQKTPLDTDTKSEDTITNITEENNQAKEEKKKEKEKEDEEEDEDIFAEDRFR